ncbi:MAG: hypothetical protein AABY18_03865 [Candidatus Thermoplasmatota archaeon]|mgnify:CR=1 FL=1
MHRTVPFLLLVGLALAAPATQAHGTYEASELEIHVLDDEGSDTVEIYGGYDVQDAFLGSAYVEGLGPAVYVRLELYGAHAQHTAIMPWRVEVSYTYAGAAYVHSLSTTDGATFTHDFAGWQAEVEPAERTLHVQRAFLSQGAPVPGQPITDLTVRSFWGDDLRDVAPGGLPVPGTGGAAEYPDPTAIAGQGRLVETPVPSPVDAYFGAVTATRNGPAVALAVANGLSKGGQHIHLRLPADAPGWTFANGTDQVILDANRTTGTLSFVATPADGAGPAIIALEGDTGGWLELELRPDGSLHTRGVEVLGATPPEPPMESPSFTTLATLAGIVLVGLLRRRK